MTRILRVTESPLHASLITFSGIVRNDPRLLAPLGHGDPSPFACFRAAAAAEEAVAAAATSGKYISYPTAAGLTEACRYMQQTCLDLPAPAILSYLLCRRTGRPLSFAPSIVTGV